MWAPTRWDSRWESIDAVIKNYPAIRRAFEEIIEEGGDRSIDARGLILAVKEPIFLVSLCVLNRLMGRSEQLKSVAIDYGAAAQLISSVIKQFENMRNEESFKLVYNDALKLARDNNINLEEIIRTLRQTTIPARFKDSIITSTIGKRDRAENEEKFRQIIYYSALDCILIELNDRFSDENMQLSKSISALNPENQTFLNLDLLKPLATHLNLDHQTLANELAVLKPMMKQSKWKTINEVLHELHPLTSAFQTTTSLIKGGMTIPVSSTTFESDGWDEARLYWLTTHNVLNHQQSNEYNIYRSIDGNLLRFIKYPFQLYQTRGTCTRQDCPKRERTATSTELILGCWKTFISNFAPETSSSCGNLIKPLNEAPYKEAARLGYKKIQKIMNVATKKMEEE
ncbi:unnamed protein product [Didymodactylos carnosus]|uniref:Uncharacterized protein n=1 Tax=Didymodactylos carnosus TaxID=1234261 RepID=A0A8S2F925_9BILA|nr:unnamed protein product [Didymodactylos carnosus]CAF4183199.1 unnamed protein product [Didymodactylos carnosus]